MKRWLAPLFSLFLCVACSNFAPEQLWQGEDVCATQEQLFSDDFSSSNQCSWSLFRSGEESAEITNQQLHLRVGTSGMMAWSVTKRTYGDIDMSVQLQQISGPLNNAFGAICRYQDEQNFYLFLISADGYYAIGRYQSGTDDITYLTGNAPNHFVAHEAINQNTAVNQLRIRCVGDELSLFVNGTQLVQLRDDALTTGDIGVAVSTFEADAVVVAFDNVQVVAP